MLPMPLLQEGPACSLNSAEKFSPLKLISFSAILLGELYTRFAKASSSLEGT